MSTDIYVFVSIKYNIAMNMNVVPVILFHLSTCGSKISHFQRHITHGQKIAKLTNSTSEQAHERD